MRFRCSLMFLFVTFAVAAVAQPPRAPRETLSITLNGKPVTINYGRPSLTGRTIDELLKKLPEDHMWRIGANQVTTLTTETDLVVGGTVVPAGKYSLYVHAPESGEWHLAINKDPGIELIKLNPKVPPAVAHELWPRLDGYDKNIKDAEVARGVMKQGTSATSEDPFTMTLTASKESAVLTMLWGNRTWTAEFKPK